MNSNTKIVINKLFPQKLARTNLMSLALGMLNIKGECVWSIAAPYSLQFGNINQSLIDAIVIILYPINQLTLDNSKEIIHQKVKFNNVTKW